MADKAREWTDKQLNKMEREITLMYQRSAKDLYKKWDAYIGKGDKRIQALEKDYRDALKVGDEQVIADVEERLKKAKEAFTYKNQYYKEMLDSVTYDMAQVNNDVRAYINGQLPEIYAKNYSQANEIVKDMKLNFALPNENAIKARILEGKIHTPYMNTDKFIKIPKDQRWNTKFINSQVLQGIIQGEDMRTISKRIFPEIQNKNGGLPERNKAAAIRNARTLVTGAENQGKNDSYKDLSERGIVLKRVWIATGDNRTRDWHLVMDGQERDIDEPFVDGNENELMYPADPDAEPETVYNCRCALTTRVIGFRNADGTIREIEKTDKGQDLHDKQIEEEKKYREWVQQEKEKAKLENEQITQEGDFVSDMKKIQDRVAENGITVDDIMEAGKLMQDEIPKMYGESFAEHAKARERYEKLKVEARKAEEEHTLWINKANKNEKLFDDKDWQEKSDELRNIWIEKRKLANEAKRAMRDTELTGDKSAQILKNKLSEIREMGADGFDIKAHLSNSRSPMRKFVEQAYDYYPTSWVQASTKAGKLSVKKSNRGYYWHYGQEIAISGFTDKQSFATSIHELGHRFEKTVFDIREQERLFYKKRTEGEELKWLGSGYGKDEKTRKDDFVNAYMGKDYGGDSYELVSMGFQYAYTDPMLLEQDPEMQQWIFGLLATIP